MIDTTCDVRTDARGKDADKYSPTLRRYHKHLWSKPLPNGTPFTLSDRHPDAYLHHSSHLGEFFLASDSVIPSFRSWKSMQNVTQSVPSEFLDNFQKVNHTIGGFMIFPGNKVDRKMTINGARGFTSQISDRFDLTLECIRRHYNGEDSPLATTLTRYADFFELFCDFTGYVRFFLLEDLVKGGNEVEFFTPFDGFGSRPVPHSVGAYQEYAQRSLEWVSARNRRIEALGIDLSE